MARKPNYKFERQERDRVKAAKKAARLEAKKARAEAGSSDDDVTNTVGDTDMMDDAPASPETDDDQAV
jgi:hypothetical protein